LSNVFGVLGVPLGGWRRKLQKSFSAARLLSAAAPVKNLEALKWEQEQELLEKKLGHPILRDDLLSYLLYPTFSPNTTNFARRIPTSGFAHARIFFYGLKSGEKSPSKSNPASRSSSSF